MFSAPAFAAYNPEHKADTNFNRMDKNKDNIVSKEEFLKPYTDRFQRIDRDGNGSISIEEMRRYWHEKKEEYEAFKNKHGRDD